MSAALTPEERKQWSNYNELSEELQMYLENSRNWFEEDVELKQRLDDLKQSMKGSSGGLGLVWLTTTAIKIKQLMFVKEAIIKQLNLGNR